MADILRKVTISSETLPPVGANNKYYFRFRMVSEDGNRASHWSPVLVTPGIDRSSVSGNGAISQIGNIVMSTWQYDAQMPGYDIFVKFDSDPYTYSGTTAVKNYSLIKELDSQSVSILVQAASQSRVVNAALTIWESEAYPLV